MASALVISAVVMILVIFNYGWAIVAGPIQTASSAKRTCKLSASAVEYTATVLMPISRHVLMMRNAISPLLAINIFLNINFGFSYLTIINKNSRSLRRIYQE